MSALESILAPIEARAEAATKGPWKFGGSYHFRGFAVDTQIKVDPHNICYDVHKEPDAAFIAHAREDIPKLIALARSQAEVIAQLVTALEQIHEYCGSEALRETMLLWIKDVAAEQLRSHPAALAAASAVNVKGEL